MAKYIDADIYEQCLIENDWDKDTEEYSTSGIFELLHDMPTADVIERSKIDKAIKTTEDYISANFRLGLNERAFAMREILEIFVRNIGE